MAKKVIIGENDRMVVKQYDRASVAPHEAAFNKLILDQKGVIFIELLTRLAQGHGVSNPTLGLLVDTAETLTDLAFNTLRHREWLVELDRSEKSDAEGED